MEAKRLKKRKEEWDVDKEDDHVELRAPFTLSFYFFSRVAV